MMTTKPLIILLATLSLLSLTEGCTCVPTTFRQHYKRAKTVVKAKLISATISPTPTPLPCLTAKPFPCLPPIRITLDRKFKFRLLRKFKGCSPGKIFFAKSFTDGGLCGIKLQPGKVYLLFLDKIAPDVGGLPDSFNLNICQGNRLFKRVSLTQRAFLRKASTLPINGCLRK